MRNLTIVLTVLALLTYVGCLTMAALEAAVGRMHTAFVYSTVAVGLGAVLLAVERWVRRHTPVYTRSRV